MTVEKILQLLSQIQSSGLPQQLEREGLNLAIFEPWTALTDAILAAWVAFWAAYLFSRANGSKPVTLWACSFLASAISSLAGVAFHGTRIVFGFTTTPTAIVWKIVPVATAAATLCLGWAAAIVWLRPAGRRIAVSLLFVEFAACLGVTFFWRDPKIANAFEVTIGDAVPVLIAILIGCALHWRDRSSRLIAAGILTAFVAGGVQASGWHKGNPPDCNDIFHIIQMAAMYLLYRGGSLLPNASATEASATIPAPSYGVGVTM